MAFCSAVHYIVENSLEDGLLTPDLYITQRFKVIGLTRLLTICMPVTSKIATYVETALSSILRRSYSDVLQIKQGKLCRTYLEICNPFGNLHVELSNFG